jgi:hypothetical protein
MIQVRVLKRRKREVKVNPKLGGQWKEKKKVLLLSGQWKEKEKVIFHLFPLFPQITLPRLSFFSFDVKVLFYHGSRSLFTHFLPFPWPINYDHVF